MEISRSEFQITALLQVMMLWSKVYLLVSNLLVGQFRHKRQNLQQAIDQSNSIDNLQKQQQIFKIEN